MTASKHPDLMQDLTATVHDILVEGFSKDLLCSGFVKAYALWQTGGWDALGATWPEAQNLGFSSVEEWHAGIEVVDWFVFVSEEYKADIDPLIAAYEGIVQSWEPTVDVAPQLCRTCKDPVGPGDEDEECWSCEDDRCDGCGGTGAAGDDAYDGYCASCADKIEVHREGGHKKKPDVSCPRCR